MKLLGYEIKMSKCSEKTGDPQQSLYIDLRDWQNLLRTKDEFIDTSTPDGQARAFASCSILASIITKKVGNVVFRQSKYLPYRTPGIGRKTTKGKILKSRVSSSGLTTPIPTKPFRNSFA